MGKPSDMDLMLLFDGELAPEQEAEVREALIDADDASAKLEALDQIGETVRTQLELETDDAEHRLGAELWELVERRLRADQAEADAAIAAPVASSPASSAGAWAGFRAWLGGNRSHIMTSVVTAGAVAMLILVFRPSTETIVERQGPERIVHVPAQPASPIVPVSSAPAAVEELSVTEGTGYILTIPGEDGDNDTTVIWIEPEESMEEPI